MRPLCTKLPKMIGYAKQFDSFQKNSFKVSDKKTVKKSKSKYGKKFSISMKKQFDSELVYGDNDKYISTKIKSYGDQINTNFQDKKIPKENSS